MYYPYLRARQFELIALRELALEGALSDIIPVLEPLTDRFNNLNLCNEIFIDNAVRPFLIVNPLVGDQKGEYTLFLDYLRNLDHCSYRVAFHFDDNKDTITTFIDEYELSECMLIVLDNYSCELELKELCENTKISHIMVLDPQRNRGLNSFIRGISNKEYIRLDAPFEKEVRNAEYLLKQANKFSEENKYYLNDGYNGFGDYTVLPREYIDGGSAPRAVVIHLTYIKAEDDDCIWIRHFTSNTNDSIANIQGKFAEACAKAVRFIDEYRISNSASTELKGYYERQHYPGLGVVKKISIKNHLLIIGEYLRNNSRV